MGMLLENRIALITGAARGIGKSIAKDFAQEGAQVVVLDILESEGKQTVSEIQAEGGRAYFINCDVTDSLCLKSATLEVEKNMGKIDILVLNAGISIKQPLDDIDEATWHQVLDVNLNGAFFTLKAFIDHIRSSKYGKIIFISSGSAYTGTGGGLNYVASKAGLNAMVLNLAKELGPLGINVNAIAPRVIHTEMLENLYPDEESKNKIRNLIPIRKIGQPEDVAYLASFLASDKSEYIHGQVILLDGGRTFQ
ncbi:SDR family NAD(P)-dependent oxidoreductase [Alkalibacter saccharofermentans]|uniref:3-oxoacyl-[acyl-carrier protein] reductase n=1 Tax=Alkalibacter saccharofermentans DSM 14828 TaxID=1120975 RepID=A0A1M4ZTE7_9FIRM|nr:SDR family NAD(P)-dependent oxidoreductase [Alkalibacter saccharofermentans]SHF21241.1 3-oxoacyl-[acyl-carrier protein] reductase [Alkalibacter saccharofermentans DSM 14828]